MRYRGGLVKQVACFAISAVLVMGAISIPGKNVQAEGAGNTTQTETTTDDKDDKDEVKWTVTFKVVNGSWNDGTKKAKTVTLTGKKGDVLTLKAEDIPAVGEKPKDSYEAGRWDITPKTTTEITEDSIYTYRYVEKKEEEIEEIPDGFGLEDIYEEEPYVCKSEWMNGQWYDANGNPSYQPQGSWKENSTGKWYSDTSGWYPVNCWQKIDYNWFYFDSDGYLVKNQFVVDRSKNPTCYWHVDVNGVMDSEEPFYWNVGNGRWWFGTSSGIYAADSWEKIDGKWYYFNAGGILLVNQHIEKYWVNENGEWVP